MEEINLVPEAFKFMALGMAIVFLFLTVMIFALKLQAKLIAKIFPIKEKTSYWKPQNNTHTNEKDTTAAITAAIIHYNNHKGNNNVKKIY